MLETEDMQNIILFMLNLGADAFVTPGVAVILALLIRGALHSVTVNGPIARTLVSTIAAGIYGTRLGARCRTAFIRATFFIERTLFVAHASRGTSGHCISQWTVAASIKQLSKAAGN